VFEKFLSYVFVGMFVLLAPLSALSNQESMLTPSVWELYVVNHNNELFDAHNLAQKSTLHFRAKNTFGGSSGCNNFFGSYEIQDLSLSFSHVGATRKMCDPKSMRIESLLFMLFRDGGVSYVLQNDELILERDSLKAVFKRVR